MITVSYKTVIKHTLVSMRVFLAVCVLFFILKPVYAADSIILMKQSTQDYANAMADVYMRLEDSGFKVKFVQSIDIGLAKAGYHSDKYRIVFFMPTSGVEDVLSKRTDLADMFPFKVTLYRDKGKVYVFSAKNASLLDDSVSEDIRARFKSWDKQIDDVVKNTF